MESKDSLPANLQKVNPYSLPCVYKSCIESSAINLLQKQLKISNCNVHFQQKKDYTQEFGKWRQCVPEKNVLYSLTNFNLSQPLTTKSNVCLTDSSTKFKLTRSETQSTRGNTEEIPKTLSIPPIPYQFQHHDGYQHFIEDYRNQYTACRLQQANHRRQVATRLRIRALDLWHGPRKFHIIVPNESVDESNSQVRYIKKSKLRLPNMKSQNKSLKISHKKMDSVSNITLPGKIVPPRLKPNKLSVPSTSL